jgi:putative endonuclease
MYFAYVIKSLSHDYFYKGHCRDLQIRLAQHNSGKTISIKNKIPFELIYFEAFETLEEAVKREKYFKTAAGRKFLKTAIPNR